MTRQTEDTMYAIHTELTESKLWGKFNAQLKKMSRQRKYKYIDVCEKWEHALREIKK